MPHVYTLSFDTKLLNGDFKFMNGHQTVLFRSFPIGWSFCVGNHEFTLASAIPSGNAVVYFHEVLRHIPKNVQSITGRFSGFKVSRTGQQVATFNIKEIGTAQSPEEQVLEVYGLNPMLGGQTVNMNIGSSYTIEFYALEGLSDSMDATVTIYAHSWPHFSEQERNEVMIVPDGKIVA